MPTAPVIIDEATLKVSLEAVTNVMTEIMQGLTSVDLRAAYSNALIAHPAGILGGVDFLNTGRVERVDTKALHLFLTKASSRSSRPWVTTAKAELSG